MNTGPVVSNTSPLIVLEKIGQLDLLRNLFQAVLVPPAVVQEAGPGVKLPSWIKEQPLSGTGPQPSLPAVLGPGESEAIYLALEHNAKWVILDDRAARKAAEGLNLPVIGTLGVLLASKRHGFIFSVRSSLDALAAIGFRIAPALRQQVLIDAGEAINP